MSCIWWYIVYYVIVQHLCYILWCITCYLTPNLLSLNFTAHRLHSLVAVLTRKRVKLIPVLLPAPIQGFHCLLISLALLNLPPCFCFSHKYLSWLPPPVAVVLLSGLVALSFFSWAKSCSSEKTWGFSQSNLGKRPSCQHTRCYSTYDILCDILVKLTSTASWTDIPPFARIQLHSIEAWRPFNRAANATTWVSWACRGESMASWSFP